MIQKFLPNKKNPEKVNTDIPKDGEKSFPKRKSPTRENPDSKRKKFY